MKFPVSAWAIRNPIPVVVLFIALMVAGISAYNALAVKQWPDLDFPIVVITVVQDGAAPSELNTQVAKVVEDSVASIEGVDAIRSTVVQGVSTTTIEFEIGQDALEVTDDVQTAINGIRADLPRGIEEPIVSRVDVSSGGPILTYAVSAPTMSDVELSWFVEDTIARRLQGGNGVARVSRVGGVDREINVTLDPARLAALGVTAPQINEALRGFVTDTSGGRAQVGGREQTVRVLGRAETVAALNDVTIPTQRGYIRLSDVAEIGDGAGEERGFARLNSRPVVAFQVQKTSEASDIEVEDYVIAEIEEMRAEYKDVQITEIVSIVDDIRANFHATQAVLLEGMLLAALVVFVFLRDWRATLICIIAMPASLIPAFAAMQLLGFSLNVVTLLSLTLVIGILIDDAIVEIENIQKRVETGESPYQASLLGADAIGLAVVATTMAIVVVFTPVSFMGGIVGQYFKSFGLTVAVSVLFSLVVARLLTPLLAAYFLKPAAKPHPRRELPAFYRKTLNWALDHRWLSSAFGGLFFAGSLGLASLIQAGFLPVEDPGYYYLSVEGPPGAARPDMERTIQDVTAKLRTRPEVEKVFATVGSGASSDPFSGGGGGDLRSGTITVVLDEERDVTTEESKAFIRPLLRQVPDARISTQGGFGAADVQIILASENGELLERTALQLQREMAGLDEFIADVRPETPPPGPELIIRPTDQAARLGVTAEALAQIARVASLGDIDANVAKFNQGERQLPIRVRLPDNARTDLASIGALEVPTASGGTTPLSSIATLEFAAGPGRINRFDRERNLSILADLQPGVSLGTAQTAVNNLPTLKNLPAGVRQAEYGNAEAMAELFGGFMGAMGAGVAMIFGVLVLLFRSFFKPVTILSALPLSIGGAFAGLLVTGLDITMPVLIGILMLLGLAAKNSILLVEFAIERERDGMSQREALLDACRERARPIIMTTFAMMAGMLPTALGLGEGAGFRQPMAVAVIGGLISSTALSLVLVPVVYEIIDDLERWLAPRFGKLLTPRDDRDREGVRHPAE